MELICYILFLVCSTTSVPLDDNSYFNAWLQFPGIITVILKENVAEKMAHLYLHELYTAEHIEGCKREPLRLRNKSMQCTHK